jgi:hypothetical protein
MYRIFNTTLQCDFPLPELPDAPSDDCSISVSIGSPALFDFVGFKKSFEWRSYHGNILCWCERRLDDYLYVFPGFASFLVTKGGNITCLPHDDCTKQMLRHLLLNQIIPRYLATSGALVLHASAVTLPNGQSVAFLGNSGFGKSTLASSFHRNGAQLISDDCILVDPGENGVTAIGGLSGIRLFPDSMNAVFHETSGFTTYTPYTEKQQLILRQDADGVDLSPCLLDAIFLLNDPVNAPQDREVNITRVSGSKAMMAMINCAFSLDPSDQQTMVRNFRNIGRTISERMDFFSLNYPRDHERLVDVRDAVTGCVS